MKTQKKNWNLIFFFHLNSWNDKYLVEYYTLENI